MINLKKILCILLTIALAFAVVACAADAPAPEAPAPAAPDAAATPDADPEPEAPAQGDEELPRVAYIVKGFADTYCYLVGMLFLEYWEENFSDVFTVDIFDGERSNEVIISLIETATALEYDVIIFQQEDPHAPVPAVRAAVAAGIPVIVGLGSIYDDGASYFVEASPLQQGSLLVEHAIAEGLVGEGTNVVILRGPDGQYHSEGRVEGFNTLLEGVGANIIASQTANWQTSEAIPIMESWLVSNPEIEAVFAANDDMAIGALLAAQAAGRDDILIFGVDATELALIEIINGNMAATVSQDTFGYAQIPSHMVAALLRGESVESVVTDSVLVLQADAAEFLRIKFGYTEADIAAIME